MLFDYLIIMQGKNEFWNLKTVKINYFFIKIFQNFNRKNLENKIDRFDFWYENLCLYTM